MKTSWEEASVCLSVRLHAYRISRTSRRIWIKLTIANLQRKLFNHINRNLYRPIENLSPCFLLWIWAQFPSALSKIAPPPKNTIHVYIISNLELGSVIGVVSRLRIGVFFQIVATIRDFCHIPSDTKAHPASYAMRIVDSYPGVKWPVSPSSNAVVKNEWPYIATPPYAFAECRLIRGREGCIFTWYRIHRFFSASVILNNYRFDLYLIV